MMAYGRLYRCSKLTLLYPHHSEAGCDEGLIGEYAVNSSADCLELFSIDVARGDDIGKRLARVCPMDAKV
ncbi:hypothetical protein [Sphingomonas sp. HMP6]|uniref:hypothetical protein n=1 Tax=Sphingomonas sp. HMP6 TaxID=1517551 RepID=UPI0018D7E4A1|nr:hypothetical protein [Sphingomonas sp. HMP6]